MTSSTALVTGAGSGIGTHIARQLAKAGFHGAGRRSRPKPRCRGGRADAFVPALRNSAHPQIVNISSGTGSLTWSTSPNPQFDYQRTSTGFGAAYRSSKTALDALTIFYAHALADDGVKVNGLPPGLRATNLNPLARSVDGDPAEAAAGAVRLCRPTTGPPVNCSPSTELSCHGEQNAIGDLVSF